MLCFCACLADKLLLWVVCVEGICVCGVWGFFVAFVLIMIVLLLVFLGRKVHILSLPFPIAQVRWLSGFLSRSSQGRCYVKDVGLNALSL